MKNFSKFIVGVLFSAVGLATNANAVPLTAPDTADITGTIIAYGGAAVALWIAYMLYPVAIKMLKGLFK